MTANFDISIMDVEQPPRRFAPPLLARRGNRSTVSSVKYAITPPGQEGWLRHQEKAAKLLSGAAGVVGQ